MKACTVFEGILHT